MVVMRHEANVQGETYKLSVVIPCYNEMATLDRCVASVLSIARDNFTLEIIIVDDSSTDDGLSIANTLAARHQEIRVLRRGPRIRMRKIRAKAPLSGAESLKRPAISLRRQA